MIRSPHPHARFSFGDLLGIVRASGVVAVLTADDVPGQNAFGVIPGFVDQPVLAEKAARYRSEAVAAVVSEPGTFLPAFPVEREPQPAVGDTSEVLDHAPLHEEQLQSIMCSEFVACGAPEEALARANAVVEVRSETPFVAHAYIEPKASCPKTQGNRVMIRDCTQAPAMDWKQTAPILGLPLDNVRIAPTAAGGGFGSKLDISVQPSRWPRCRRGGPAGPRTPGQKACRPRASGIRRGLAPGWATKDSKLSGMTVHGDVNTGPYSSCGPTVAIRVPVHASGPYVVRDYEARSRVVFTHNPPAGTFRGFGVPQSAIAQEVFFDDLAVQLGMDRLEFRTLNALGTGAGPYVARCSPKVLGPNPVSRLCAITSCDCAMTGTRRGLPLRAV